METNKPLIFISWSKPLSQKLALLLKNFLIQVLDLKHGTDIFVSTQNLTGNSKGWFQEVLEQASVAPIIIPCITKDSIKSPWLHFETGIGTSLKKYPTKVIPFLFNLNVNDVNLEMYKFHQMVHSDIHDREMMFKDLLCQLVFSISTFLKKNHNAIYNTFGTTFCCRDYDTLDIKKISNDYSVALTNAIQKLEDIKDLYEIQDFYISRPIQGITPIDARKYEKIISEMVEVAKKMSFQCFYGKTSPNSDTRNLSFYRMGILKECQNFILIYPNISGENLAPSSCLIELGGALAYDKNIVLFIQNEANVPVFMNDLIEVGYKCYYYKDQDDLKNLWYKYLYEFKNPE